MRLRCGLFECCFAGTSVDTISKDRIQLKWPIIPYSELAKATNNFDQSNCLRRGDLVTVYYGKLEDGRQIAIERFCKDKRPIFQQFIYETVILDYLPHKNLVSIYGCTTYHKESLLVHEYLSNGTLAAHLQGEITESSTLPWLT